MHNRHNAHVYTFHIIFKGLCDSKLIFMAKKLKS